MTDRSAQFQRMAFEANAVLSTATVRRAIGSAGGRGLGHKLSGLRAARIVRSGQSVEQAVAAVSDWMLGNYRSEALYKTAVANRLFLGRHRPGRASMLHEFRVGASVADCVVVNGTGTVYEIKTELDNPAKLAKQLQDYRQAFQSVVVVTHRSLAGIYCEILRDSPVGLVVLDDQGDLRTRRAPRHDPTGLSVDVMFRALRKAEYAAIAETIAGHSIDVTPVTHFSACLEASRTATPEEFSQLFNDALRARQPRAGERVTNPLFRDIRHQVLQIDPTSDQIAKIERWMAERA